ncbi:MAG TPA: uroporphyrinogen decarboxylase family protein [Candidatus Paceibacterota bacterium]|nr:uroporphyrinogen decarboxylase family protein [Candidatus Paceibacterota bacterium]HRT55636.1 uroporphyrinogen decarboxylase family protein [Candidatus Paceibacterota bacterium]
MSTLTSRERVRLALDHQEPDRVPVDFGASRITGIGAIAYRNLLQHLGWEEEVKVYDVKQQLAEPSLAVLNRLGADVVQVHRLGPTSGLPFLEIDRWKAGRLTDGSPCLVPAAYEESRGADGAVELRRNGQLCAWRAPESFYFDVCYAPLADAQTPADINAFVWPDPWTEREEAYLKDRIQQLYYGTDKALFAGLPMLVCSFFEISLVLFGFENFMMKLASERDLVEYWLEAKLAHDLAILDKFLAIAGPYLEAIQMNDDFGAQDSLQISPRLYRELFKPRQKRWIEFVKARTRAKVFMHCDGAIREILPDFIEIGIDVLNPLQTSARGMDPREIKRQFGRDLAFWGGGVETQTTLPFGTCDDVRREVRERIRLLGPGGGFVFATIHNIQPDIPPEKVLAIYETVAECGRYPLS